jgi:hypothetical protein
MTKRRVSASRHAWLATLLALGALVACTQKRDPREVSQPLVPRMAALASRCGPGLAAEDLAGNCRDKDCPTMGALEAEPPRPPGQPCPRVAARAPAKPAAKATPK